MMTDAIVVGGGFAGLSAATLLAERGLKVTVLEGRRRLGGRAYSFRDDETGDVVDNGQHLFMGCYRETRRLLARLGTGHLLRFQPDLRVDFLTQDGNPAVLRCPRLPAPYHLLAGFAGLSTVTVSDIFRLRHVISDLAVEGPSPRSALTVAAWLRRCRQSDTIRAAFWNPLTLSALNESPDVACAESLAAVLRKGFMGGREDGCLGVPTVGLSDLYALPAKRFLESRGGEVRVGTLVSGLDLRGDGCQGVLLKDGTRLAAGVVVSAVPAAVLTLLLPGSVPLLRTSPIVSVNLWFDRPVMRQPFVGLLGTESQWAFNRSMILNAWDRPCVAVVISAARDQILRPQKDLIRLAVSDLRRLCPEARGACVTRAFAVKERDATVSPGVGISRPKQQSPWRNLFLAGDWTDTGLPATVESAVISGHRCADLAMAGG